MSTDFAGKSYLVLGAGVTGSSISQFIMAQGGRVSICDDVTEGALRPALVALDDFDAVVISPGWREEHPLVQKILHSKMQLLNEIDIAWMIRCERSPHQKWLAVTGTNGKTTTVEMVAMILQRAGISAVACGNVGDTVIDAVSQSKLYDVLVIELSSFQLHWSQKAEFAAAAILNIADDHIDWHGSFDAYAAAKLSILDRAEIGILNGDDGVVVQRSQRFEGRKVFFSLDTPAPGELGVVEEILIDRAFVSDPQEASIVCELVDIVPTVPHNVSNALAASALARVVGVSHADIQQGLHDFRPGRHRIERVEHTGQISWINDSKATNPHAAAASIMSHLSVIWIAGGLAKGADMGPLVERCMSRIKAVILIGSDSSVIEEELIKFIPNTPRIKIDVPDDYVRGGSSNSFMEAVVLAAAKFAISGDAVLMAPACASMDQFISYGDRGDRFVAAVTKVVAHET